MSDEKLNYKNIIKTTSILGGAQVLQILVTIIRGKFVAVLLGKTGMGINALLTSALSLMFQATSLGLDFSGVRDLAQANAERDQECLQRTFTYFKRWSYVTAIGGVFLICLLSPFLSYISFDNFEYILSFCLLSLALFFMRLNAMNSIILQGMRQFGSMAKASLLGSTLSTAISIPFFYLWGQNGIVPAIIATYIAMWAVNAWFAHKLRLIINKQISFSCSLNDGLPMIKFGIASMISGFIPTVSLYLINSFVGSYGSLADVGLYAAGTTITTQYVGLIFNAMSTEYYPRLSSLCYDTKQMNVAVNQQAEIVTLILAPLLIIMMITAPLIIKILLTQEFLSIREFIIYLAFGTFFRAASYTVGFISYAKGDKKFFVYWEGFANGAFILSYNIIGYMLGGINGMAIAFAFGYFTYFVLITIVAGRKYNFKFEIAYWQIFSIQLICCSTMLISSVLFKGVYMYVIGSVICIISLIYSYKELDKRIGISNLLAKFKRR